MTGRRRGALGSRRPPAGARRWRARHARANPAGRRAHGALGLALARFAPAPPHIPPRREPIRAFHARRKMDWAGEQVKSHVAGHFARQLRSSDRVGRLDFPAERPYRYSTVLRPFTELAARRRGRASFALATRRAHAVHNADQFLPRGASPGAETVRPRTPNTRLLSAGGPAGSAARAMREGHLARHASRGAEGWRVMVFFLSSAFYFACVPADTTPPLARSAHGGGSTRLRGPVRNTHCRQVKGAPPLFQASVSPYARLSGYAGWSPGRPPAPPATHGLGHPPPPRCSFGTPTAAVAAACVRPNGSLPGPVSTAAPTRRGIAACAASHFRGWCLLRAVPVRRRGRRCHHHRAAAVAAPCCRSQRVVVFSAPRLLRGVGHALALSPSPLTVPPPSLARLGPFSDGSPRSAVDLPARAHP